MSTAGLGLVLDKKVISEWYHPDTPEFFGKNRRCDMGKDCKVFKQIGEVGKVRGHTSLRYGVLLCGLCDEERENQGKTHRQFVGREYPEEGALAREEKYQRYELKNLRSIRKARGLSQSALARQAGVCVDQVCKVENKRRNAAAKTACMLAEALEVTLDELRGVSGEQAQLAS